MIEDLVNNVTSNVSNAARSAFDTATNTIRNVLGTANATLGSLYDGGFVGINANNIDTITTAVNNMITQVEGVLAGFNAAVEFEAGLKGEAAAAASEYVAAVKELVFAYTSTYKNFIKLANDAAEQWKTGDTANAQAIQTGTDAIMKEANTIRVDDI